MSTSFWKIKTHQDEHHNRRSSDLREGEWRSSNRPLFLRRSNPPTSHLLRAATSGHKLYCNDINRSNACAVKWKLFKKTFFHRNDVVTTKTSIVQSNTGHRLILAIILMHDSVCFCCWLFCLHVKKLNVLICLKSFCSPWFYHRFHAT